MRLVAGSVFFVLLLAGRAPAETLIQSQHHYRLDTPAGWVSAPGMSNDYQFRPRGATAAFPLITVVCKSSTERNEPLNVMRELRTSLEEAIAKNPGLKPVVQEGQYNPVAHRITIDYEIQENGQVVKRCSLMCVVGEYMLIGAFLTSYPLTYEIYKPALVQLADSILIDPGYTLPTSSNTRSRFNTRPAPREPVQRPEPAAQRAPEEEAPAPRPQPATMMPWFLGGAACAFVGFITLALLIIGAIVFMSRRKPTPSA